MRMRAALAATTVAEAFAAQGKHVLLVLDSLTRFAMAAREIGLAAGEPPTSKGYTPSVFTRLAKLVERTGQFRVGSITAFYTVLMEGDDQQDPLVDAVRSLLDGHIVLSRALAAEGWYPPIASRPRCSAGCWQSTRNQKTWCASAPTRPAQIPISTAPCAPAARCAPL
jgi:flagellum-specific ATP synthase